MAFGLNVNPDVTATLIALVVAVAAAFQRTQTSPLPQPTFREAD